MEGTENDKIISWSRNKNWARFSYELTIWRMTTTTTTTPKSIRTKYPPKQKPEWLRIFSFVLAEIVGFFVFSFPHHHYYLVQMLLNLNQTLKLETKKNLKLESSKFMHIWKKWREREICTSEIVWKKRRHFIYLVSRFY